MAGSRYGTGRPEKSKVPDITPWFWIVKILTTCMGEAISDWLVNDVNQYLGVVLGFVVFVIGMIWQFRTPTYRTSAYWFAVSMVAVFGTMCADVVHVVLGLPYIVSSIGYAIILAAVLITWYASERTLSIHTIVNPRRETFYWLTVISTFAMGTAVGDLTAQTFHLGYLTSGFMFTGAILVPLIAWRLGVNPVLTFWVAYILTRPIGASFADYFGFGKEVGGLGVGHGTVSLVTTILVVAFVAYLAKTGKDLIGPRDGAGYAADPRVGYEQVADGPRAGSSVRPGLGQPGLGQPGLGQPGLGQPGLGQPGYGQLGYGRQPEYGGEPEYAPQPGYSQQGGYGHQSEHGAAPGHQPAPSFTPKDDQGLGHQSPPPGW